MNDFLSRRSLLSGVGTVAVYGALASQFASLARAGEEASAAAPAAAAPELIYSTMFLGGPRTKFDFKRYENRHMPLLKKSFGDSVSRIEMRTANATARGVPTDIRVTTAVYIANPQEFVKALTATNAAINVDLAEVNTGPKNVQFDRQLVEIGAPRSEVRVGHQVVSTFYREKPDVKFDLDYYTNTYLPKLRSYYNEGAVRRIEVVLGVSQGGVKPAILAATHLFIRERDAYNQANGQGQRELMQIDEKYTNAEQMWADSKITAVV